MLFIFSTPELIRNLWQLKTVVFLHWCLIRAVPLRCILIVTQYTIVNEKLQLVLIQAASCYYLPWDIIVSYPMLRMTHPSRNFFGPSLFCVLCMFVWLRVQGFGSSVNKVFQKEKLVNSKTIRIYSPLKGVGANLVR